MTDRPYHRCSFEELEITFNEKRSNVSILNSLLEELRLRKKNKRIPILMNNIEEVLANISANMQDDSVSSGAAIVVKDITPSLYAPPVNTGPFSVSKFMSVTDIAERFSLSVRTLNVLRAAVARNQIPEKIGQLLELGDDLESTLMRLENFGKKSCYEFMSLLSKLVIVAEYNSNSPQERVTSEECGDTYFFQQMKEHGLVEYIRDANILEQLHQIEICSFLVELGATKKLRRWAENKTFPYKNVGEAVVAQKKYLTSCENISITGAGNKRELQSILVSGVIDIIDVYKNIDQYRFPQLISKALNENLNEKERYIIRSRFPTKREDIKTLSDVGKVVGVTRERVRQIENSSIKKLQTYMQLISTYINLHEINKDFIEDKLFGQLDFVSYMRAADIVKSSQYNLRLIFEIMPPFKLNKYLSDHYIEVDDLGGVCKKETEILEGAHSIGIVNINDLVSSCHWPIYLSELCKISQLPRDYLIDLLSQNYRYKLIERDNDILIRSGKFKNSERMMFVFRSSGREMKTEEIKEKYEAMFGKSININQITSTIGRMEGALITGRSTYNIYENLHLSKEELGTLRVLSNEYLRSKNRFTSAKVILEDLKKTQTKARDVLERINGYVLLGILQDSNEFECRRGLMVGLCSESFTGEYMSLQDEIVELIKSLGRKVSAYDVIEQFASHRSLIVPSVQAILETSSHFESSDGKFFGISKNGSGGMSKKSILDVDDFSSELF